MKWGICFVKEEEVRAVLKGEGKVTSRRGFVEVELGDVAKLQDRFGEFLFEGTIEEAISREMRVRKMRLALAESCTGGSIAARITSVPGASEFFLGSIVAYSNEWKERFLEVSRSTIEEKGAVSKEGVVEMVRGLMQETEADYVAAVSGIAGPGGGSREKPVGTVFIAIGKRGDRIDVGRLQGPMEREACMEFAGSMVLGALWRRVVHNAVTFS